MIDMSRIKTLTKKIDKVGDHELKLFVANVWIDELKIIKNDNLLSLFTLCTKFGVRYIKIHGSEICGCENVRYHGCPAMWEIAKKLGINGRYGNSDQYQTIPGKWFPDEAYGEWDIVENRKLTIDELKAHKFHAVVSRSWSTFSMV